MSRYILALEEINTSDVSLVGGKAATLAELARMQDIKVPDGFCITTHAFKEVIVQSADFQCRVTQLASLKAESRKEIAELGSSIRDIIERTVIPDTLIVDIVRHLRQLGTVDAFAVRSSATAEDLPGASFAGQQDSYLNVRTENVLRYVSRCWASLFTDRAIVYRLQNGFAHDQVYLSVIVQRMVFADAAGIAFTADPLTGNRRVTSIDAGFGLGEALVSGLVNPDEYKVQDGVISHKKISPKEITVVAAKDGGTKKLALTPDKQYAQVLTDPQILDLEHICRKLEQHSSNPQDIEWCLADGIFYVVQSRPITTLFPVPEAPDNEKRVYVSVGHQQMMTDPIRPLGLSFYLLLTRAPMRTAAGRLFVDVTAMLASPDSRATVMSNLGQSDPLIKDALLKIIGRENFITPSTGTTAPDRASQPTHRSPYSPQEASAEDVVQTVKRYMSDCESSLQKLEATIATKSDCDLFAFIEEDFDNWKKLLFDNRLMSFLMSFINASAWINEKMFDWLGEKKVADTLSQSLANNITSEMGLELLDVADAIRPHPEAIRYLQRAQNENFSDGLSNVKGGTETKTAINNFLMKYGIRCAGEIDITRDRWIEKPATLVPLILSNIKNFEAGEGKRKFNKGLQEALNKEKEVLDRLKDIPGGDQKAQEAKQKIAMIRQVGGYREYPKYAMIKRYYVYKKALMKEADKLLEAGIIQNTEDVFYLSFHEFKEVVKTRRLDNSIISRRREQYKAFEKMVPPRVITSEGEIITGEYKKENLPPGALAGLAVSSGVIEGRARVIQKIEEADLGEEDILVTVFTDPSWTPLFVSVKALVTEVGGLMTHGAVIAREYGLPAVVGVQDATKVIKDGQRIRVNGTEGFVEIL